MNQQFPGQQAPTEKQMSAPVARVRVAVKGSSRTSDEPRLNDALALMWQAFCAIEGSPSGLEVIDQRTRCIRAPLLKRFCQFLDNNRIALDHADCVERLLQREAPHMDWKPVIPEMLHLPHKSKIPHSPSTKKRPASTERPSPTIGIVDGTASRIVQLEAKEASYQETKGRTLHDRIRQEEMSPKTSTKHSSLSPEDEVVVYTQDNSSARGAKSLLAQAKDRSYTNNCVLEAQQSRKGKVVDRFPRKGEMRLDPAHISLLSIKKKPKKSVATPNPTEHYGTTKSVAALNPTEHYGTPSVPTESELRGNDQHAWPLLTKDLQFIFQSTLWPAFCRKENFRLPECYLPGYGFGLIDSRSDSIRIALVLKFFRFLKKDSDQATMARCVRILNKVILTESLSRGLDWEIISLEKVKPILKIIGVKTLDDALPKPPPNNLDLQAILALNRDLTQNTSAPIHSLPARNIPAGSEAELQLLQLRQQMNVSSSEPAGSRKVDDLLRRVFQEDMDSRAESRLSNYREHDNVSESKSSKSDEHSRSESRLSKIREHDCRSESRSSKGNGQGNTDESRSPKDRAHEPRPESRLSKSSDQDNTTIKEHIMVSKVAESLPKRNNRTQDTHHADLKAKCSNIVESVEDLIKSMEAAQNRSPSFDCDGSEDAEAQEQYQMVADSLNKLTKKAALLLENTGGESGSGSDPMANTLMMLKSSVETLSSKLDAVSHSIRSRNELNDSRRTAPTSVVDLSSPQATSFDCRSPWDYAHGTTSDDESDSELNDDDIEMVRKRAILCHAAAERDRLKKQRTD